MRGPHPGLLIAWQKRNDVWFAHVVYLVEPEGVLVQEWVPASLLTPVAAPTRLSPAR